MYRYFTPTSDGFNPEQALNTDDSGLTGLESEALLKSGMVLKDELWMGQEHGASSESNAHSRFFRPLCERFSTGSSPWCCMTAGFPD